MTEHSVSVVIVQYSQISRGEMTHLWSIIANDLSVMEVIYIPAEEVQLIFRV